MKFNANTVGYVASVVYICRAILGAVAIFSAPTLSSAQDFNTPMSQDEVNRVFVEKNAESTQALKNAYIGGMMIKAEAEAKMNPSINNNPQAVANYVKRAAQAARKETEGVSFRSGTVESVLKGSVTLASGLAALPATGLGPVGTVVAATTVKTGGDYLVEKGLDLISNKPVEIGMHPEVSVNIRQIMAKRAQDDDPTARLFRKEFIQNENTDPKSFAPSGETYKNAIHKKEVMLKLAGNDEKLISLINSARNQKELTEGLKRLSKEQLNKLNGLAGESKKVVENLNILLDDRAARLEKEERAHQRQQITDGFDGMSGIATLTGNPVLAEKLKTGGQLAGTLHDMSGMTLKGLIKNPGSYLNTTALALNLTTALLGGSNGGEMAAVLSGIRALQEQIQELRKVMLEEFHKLNLKIDGYFTETFQRLDSLKAGQSLDLTFTEEILEQMKTIRELVEDGVHDVIQVQFNSTLSGCTISTKSLTESQFANCRNTFGLVALGRVKPGMNLGDKTLPEKIETRGTMKVLAEAAAEAYPGEFNKDYIPYPDDWMWATGKLLLMSTLYPNMKALVIKDGLNSTPITLEEIAKTGQRFRQYNYKLALDDSKRPRTELFKRLLEKYKSAVEKSLSKTTAAITRIEDRGPKFGRDFSTDQFIPKDSDKFLDMKISMCKGDDGKPKKPNFVPTIEPCGYYSHGSNCGLLVDRTAVTALTSVGEQKLNIKFHKFFPPSVLFGARQSSDPSNKRKVTPTACFEQWEVQRAEATPRKRSATFAVTLRIGFDYYPMDSETPVHVDLHDLTFNRTYSSPAYHWDRGNAMSVAMWNGLTVDWNPFELTPSGGIIDNPVGVFYKSQVIDKEQLKKYEYDYKVMLNTRNDDMQSNVTQLNTIYSNTSNFKGAMLYVLQQYSANSDAALQLHEWLIDETHLPAAEKWNKALSDGSFTRAQLLAKLEKDYSQALELIEELGKSTPQVDPSTSIAARILDIQQLESEAKAAPQ